jgi:hypothetical protein
MYAFSGRAVFNSVARVTLLSALSVGASPPSFPPSFFDFEAIFPANHKMNSTEERL